MPMSKPEEAAVELGRQILDAALRDVGEPPLATNPNIREGAPIAGLFPVYSLHKPNCLPLIVHLGTDLDVGIGPFAEFMVREVSVATAAELRADLARLFTAEMELRRGRLRSWTVQLYLDGSPLWTPATYWGIADQNGLVAGRFGPFATPPNDSLDSGSA